MEGGKGIFFKSGKEEFGSDTYVDELVELAARRAENFFKEHRLSCSEAALLVINLGFKGGLTAQQALCLGSGFGGGVGGSGCVCGALSGAVMALGLFLGPSCPDGLGKKKFRKLVAGFHGSFLEKSSSVCCRDLIADFKKDRKGKAFLCRSLTGNCTGEAVRIILEERPELAERADMEFLKIHDSGIAVLLKKLLGHSIDDHPK